MADRRFWLAGAMLVVLPGAALAQAQSAPVQPPATQPPAATADPAATPPAKPPAQAKAAAPPVKTIEAITVTGLVPDEKSTIDTKSYTLSRDLQATTGSIGDALRNVPSVEVDLQGNLSLRGDQNVTILVDGKPSPAFEGKGRADALQQLPADQIERVEVITNPSAAQNPEGTGGVINLITKQSRGGGVTGSTYVSASTAGLKRAGINLGYNTKTLSVTGSLSGNYQRNKNHTTDDRDGLDPVSGQFLDNFDKSLGRNLTRGPSARLNITWTPLEADQFTAAMNYSGTLVHGHPDDLYTDEQPNGAPAVVFDHPGRRRYIENASGYSSGWKHTFGEGHELSVDAVYNVDLERDHSIFQTVPIQPIVAPPPLELIRDDYSQHHEELRVAYTQPLAGGSLKTGYELRREDNDANYVDSQGPTQLSLVPVPSLANHYLFTQAINAVYGTWQKSFGDLDTQVGLRLEDVRFTLAQLTQGDRPGQHYDKAYPTLHLGYKLDDERKLTASYSVRVQRPPTVFLNPLIYIEGPQDAQVGNPNLKPKETESFELGYEQHAGSQSYQATLYIRNTEHDFSQVLFDLGDGRFEYSFGNLGSNKAVGLDLAANGKITSTLTYNLTLSPYWNQIDAGNLGAAVGTRSTFSAGGRANLNWQATPDDLAQFNAISGGERLQPQGVLEPYFIFNTGWRHKIDDRTSATITVQDLLGTNRFRRSLETPTLIEDLVSRPVSRSIIFRLDYRFGGGAAKAKTPDFDYGPAGPRAEPACVARRHSAGARLSARASP